jgi:hypothetical protein
LKFATRRLISSRSEPDGAQHIGSSRAGREDSAGACSTSFAGAIGLKILVLNGVRVSLRLLDQRF